MGAPNMSRLLALLAVIACFALATTAPTTDFTELTMDQAESTAEDWNSPTVDGKRDKFKIVAKADALPAQTDELKQSDSELRQSLEADGETAPKKEVTTGMRARARQQSLCRRGHCRL